jgi:DNA-binding NarL/FixJ family response regulator
MLGGSPMSPRIARKVIQHFHQHGNSANYPLCDRERNILKFLVKGLPTKIISGKVFLSEDGVKKNLKNIYNKLKVNSGKGAVAKAVRERII